MVHRLLHEEGIFVGGSAGLNVAGAVEVAKKLGESPQPHVAAPGFFRSFQQ
jgi:cysteine synthase